MKPRANSVTEMAKNGALQKSTRQPPFHSATRHLIEPGVIHASPANAPQAEKHAFAAAGMKCA